MNQADAVAAFLDAADGWLCDNYSLDVRYIAHRKEQHWTIWSASVGLSPIRAEQHHELKVSSKTFVLGQHHAVLTKASARRILREASKGTLHVHKRTLSLMPTADLSYYSEMQQRDRWFCDLHLQVQGIRLPLPSPTDASRIDNHLRGNEVPFDGLEDAAAWLGLPAPWLSAQPPSITLRVLPPVDLMFDSCLLRENDLSLTLKAHSEFDTSKVGLAVRAVPGDGLLTRRQIGKALTWQSDGDLQSARLSVPIDRADNALTVLMIGDTVVRRQWFIDSARARNNRYFAMQHFDKDLRMLRKAVLESNGREFEAGVAALLFVLGFSTGAPAETDAPDLVVTTPQGRLVLIECTSKLSDVMAKLGKLVQRRGALSESLKNAGHVGDVVAVLVCRVPRAQIAVQLDDLKAANVVLVAGELLLNALETVRIPRDPDVLLDQANKAIQSTNQ